MGWKEFTIKFLHESREWAKFLLSGFLVGWHFPQPRWVKWLKKPEKGETQK